VVPCQPIDHSAITRPRIWSRDGDLQERLGHRVERDRAGPDDRQQHVRDGQGRVRTRQRGSRSPQQRRHRHRPLEHRRRRAASRPPAIEPIEMADSAQPNSLAPPWKVPT
jgi:hypothetical protein